MEWGLIKFNVMFIVLTIAFERIFAMDDALMFSVTKPPRYFGVLQDHRQQPMSVELAEDYTDQDYFANNKKHHNTAWNKNPLDADDVEDDDSEEIAEEKDGDVKLPRKLHAPQPPAAAPATSATSSARAAANG